MPIMPNGTFKDIGEVRSKLRTRENIAAAMRRYGSNAKALMTLEAEAAELRAIVEAYEKEGVGMTAREMMLFRALMNARDFIADQYADAEAQALDGEYVAREAQQIWAEIHDALKEAMEWKT